MAARARLSLISFKHACAACVFLCILLSGVATVLADVLDDDAARGRQLFLTGQARAPGLRATIGAGDVTIPATAVPCASCHGRDGHGRKENGIAPPDITWSSLMRPSSRDASSGRSRSAYTEQSLVRAMTMGIDASGNRLDPVMPRFKLSLADAADLVAYLKRLGGLREPGLHDRSLVVGVVLRPGESDIRRVLAAYFDEINRNGGLFGRHLVLQVADWGENEAAGSAVARLAAADTVFALLVPMIAGDESRAVAAVDSGGVPTIGPITPRTLAAPRSRYVFYLTGGVEAEGRALAQFAARTHGTPAIVADASALWQGAARAAASALANTGTSPQPMLPDDPNVAAAIGGGGPVLWLAEGRLARSAVAGSAGKPTLMLPGALADDLLAKGAPVPTYVAFASGPADITSEAAAEFRALAARGDGAPQDRSAREQSAQRFALVAAKVLVEALRRAGRAVTRERLVDAIEALRDYRTGLLPPLSFSPSQHVGTDGVWIVPLHGGAAIWWTK